MDHSFAGNKTLTKMIRPIIFLGSNSNMLYLADICDLQQIPIAGIIDSDYHGNQTSLDDIPIIGNESETDFDLLKQHHDFFVASNAVPGNDRDISKRQKFIALCDRAGLPLANIIDPTARISRKTKLGRGVLIGFCSFISAHCSIGDHTQIYGHSAVGHHIEVGSNVTVQRQVVLSGKHITLCDDVYVGIGVRIFSLKDKLTIGRGARIAPGLVVSRDVDAYESVMPYSKRVYNAGLA